MQQIEHAVDINDVYYSDKRFGNPKRQESYINKKHLEKVNKKLFKEINPDAARSSKSYSEVVKQSTKEIPEWKKFANKKREAFRADEKRETLITDESRELKEKPEPESPRDDKKKTEIELDRATLRIVKSTAQNIRGLIRKHETLTGHKDFYTKDEVESLVGKPKAPRKEAKTLRKEVNALRDENEKLNNELKTLRDASSRMRENIELAEKESATEHDTRLREDIARLMAENSRLTSENIRITKERDDIKAENVNYVQNYSRLNYYCWQQSNRIALLERQRPAPRRNGLCNYIPQSGACCNGKTIPGTVYCERHIILVFEWPTCCVCQTLKVENTDMALRYEMCHYCVNNFPIPTGAALFGVAAKRRALIEVKDEDKDSRDMYRKIAEQNVGADTIAAFDPVMKRQEIIAAHTSAAALVNSQSFADPFATQEAEQFITQDVEPFIENIADDTESKYADNANGKITELECVVRDVSTMDENDKKDLASAKATLRIEDVDDENVIRVVYGMREEFADSTGDGEARFAACNTVLRILTGREF